MKCIENLLSWSPKYLLLNNMNRPIDITMNGLLNAMFSYLLSFFKFITLISFLVHIVYTIFTADDTVLSTSTSSGFAYTRML